MLNFKPYYAPLSVQYNFLAVEAGGSFSLALLDDNTLLAWGAGSLSQDFTLPAGTYTEISAANNAGFAIQQSDGQIVGFGPDLRGVVSTVPVGSFTKMDTGDTVGLAIASDGSIVGWGEENPSYLGVILSNIPTGTDFIDVAIGSHVAAAVRQDGTLEVWGDDTNGIVTNAPTTNDFVAVGAFSTGIAAVRQDGSLVAWAWGNEKGMMENVPSGTDFVDVVGGGEYVIAHKNDGTIESWGNNASNRVTDEPSGSFVYLSASSSHAFGTRSDGTIFGWGNDIFDRISGAPTTSSTPTLPEEPVPEEPVDTEDPCGPYPEYTPINLPSSITAQLRIDAAENRIYHVDSSADESVVLVTSGNHYTDFPASPPYDRYTGGKVRIYDVDSSQNYTLRGTFTYAGTGLMDMNFGQNSRVSPDGNRAFIGGYRIVSGNAVMAVASVVRNLDGTFSVEAVSQPVSHAVYTTMPTVHHSLYAVSEDGTAFLTHSGNPSRIHRYDYDGSAWSRVTGPLAVSAPVSDDLSKICTYSEQWSTTQTDVTINIFEWEGTGYVQAQTGSFSLEGRNTTAPRLLEIKDNTILGNISAYSVPLKDKEGVESISPAFGEGSAVLQWFEVQFEETGEFKVTRFNTDPDVEGPAGVFEYMSRYPQYLGPHFASNTSIYDLGGFRVKTVVRVNATDYVVENEVNIGGIAPPNSTQGGLSTPRIMVVGKQGRIYMVSNELDRLYTVDVPVTPNIIGCPSL